MDYDKYEISPLCIFWKKLLENVHQLTMKKESKEEDMKNLRIELITQKGDEKKPHDDSDEEGLKIQPVWNWSFSK